MKPMLAATVEDTATLQFPLLASPKLDGIRALVIDGVVVSRSLKQIPNAHVQALFGKPEYNGLDGELICGDPTSPTAFRDTTSAVMSKDGTPDVTFWVFDDFEDPNIPFSQRLENAMVFVANGPEKPVPHTEIHNLAELDKYEHRILEMGYEGVMLRDPNGKYKFGRSTLRERGLAKLKRFEDAEAVIEGFEEQLHNTNEAKTDALGHTERSSHKSGMVGKGTLGALVVHVLNGRYEGVTCSIGSGMDDAIRSEIWAERQAYKGRIVKFKYFPIGAKDKPRFPIFLGFRDGE